MGRMGCISIEMLLKACALEQISWGKISIKKRPRPECLGPPICGDPTGEGKDQ